ncbi:MAG: HAD-IA family hydrolase [Spirochaetia bacterium]|jgi:HAD superfamily hydrolase (TIGR01509 family)|nr:HAD-IA family hydrolase [Spirochaetia bacterium]
MEKLKAVFFDQDGVIIETEKDGHRVAFNSAFKEFGLDIEWDGEYYNTLLKVGGGKERIRYYLEKINYTGSEYQKNPDSYIKKIHLKKTEIFVELIKSGKLPLRPGIRRLMEEINSRGIFLGICTTSNEKAALAVEKYMLKGIQIDMILAGDIVKHKKPDPEIYKLALKKSGIPTLNAFVVEDSRIGVLAAKAAGLSVIATLNEYTIDEDVSSADIIVDSLEADGGITFGKIESYL